MRLKKALGEKLMDVRLRDKLLGEGKISDEQVASYQGTLGEDTYTFTEDEANKAAPQENTEE